MTDGYYRYNIQIHVQCSTLRNEPPHVLGCLSNCQEYIKAKAQNLISDKVSLDTNQRCKVFNAYRRGDGSKVGSNIAFPKSDTGLPPSRSEEPCRHSNKDDMVDPLNGHNFSLFLERRQGQRIITSKNCGLKEENSTSSSTESWPASPVSA